MLHSRASRVAVAACAEVDFNGGDVQFLQECRGRVRVILTLERAG